MKTFNLTKSFDELSFDEILPIITEIADEVSIFKVNDEENNIIYHVHVSRDIKDYKNDIEYELYFLSFKWIIDFNDETKDSLENQARKYRDKLYNYIEYAEDLGIINLKEPNYEQTNF